MTSEVFVQILKDLDIYARSHNIKRPLILFMDGASPHISLSMAKFCRDTEIQPWLFKPNNTHLCQPLDLSFFGSLKSGLRQKLYMWHQDHIGLSMTRYAVVPLLQAATESILQNKLGLIGNGFRKAGLFPWNTDAVDMTRMGPSAVFEDGTR